MLTESDAVRRRGAAGQPECCQCVMVVPARVIGFRRLVGGTPRSGRYKSELLHRVETSEGAFSRQLCASISIFSH